MINNGLTFDNISENYVLAVEPVSHSGSDEELRAIGVWSRVSHGELVFLGVLEDEVLVLELVAVDALASSAVVVGEVPALTHEVGDNSMESGTGISVSFFSSA